MVIQRFYCHKEGDLGRLRATSEEVTEVGIGDHVIVTFWSHAAAVCSTHVIFLMVVYITASEILGAPK